MRKGKVEDFLSDIHRVPFFRLLLPLLSGIILQAKLHILGFDALHIIIPVLLFVIILFIARFASWSLRYIWGAAFFIIMFATGCRLVQSQKTASELPLDKQGTFEILVWDNPRERANSFRIEGVVRAYTDSTGNVTACNEHIFLYLPKSDSICSLHAGDKILCNTVPNVIPGPRNPDEFDYRTYLARHGIFASAFVNERNIRVIAPDALPLYRKYPLAVQQLAYNTFSKAGLSGNELAVAIALTVGAQHYLDEDLRQAYVSSGTVHLLAVSGMHVGMIFIVLSFILGFLDKRKNGKMLKSIIILALLWFYAAVAGMAPSVMRATFMFTVFIIGDVLAKQRNMYNCIAFSCFALCAWNPWNIFDTGFQLSYSAVLGIVYLYPKLRKLVYIKNRYLDKVRELACVSVAAQIGTLPVIIYVFKQFPLYFVFTNIILVPLVPLIMYSALLLLGLWWWPWLLGIVGTVAGYGIKLMNKTVELCDRLPYSIIDGIYINGLQCALLVVALLLLAAYLSFRRNVLLQCMLVSLIGVFTIRAVHLYELNDQNEFGVFAVRRAFYAYSVEGRSGKRFSDSASMEQNFNFNTKNYLTRLGFKSEQDLTNIDINSANQPNIYKGVMLFNGKRIGFSSRLHYDKHYQGDLFEIDYLLITDASRISLQTLLGCYLPRFIVISDNMSAYQADSRVFAAEERSIPCHYVKTDGVWRVKK